MAIFNITNQTTELVSSASWINNNPEMRPKPSMTKRDTTSSVSDLVSLDRFMIHSKIFSGSTNTVRSNNTTKSDSILAMRTTHSNSAIRENDYIFFTNAFKLDFPINSLYYLPKQNISSIFVINNNYYSYRKNVANIQKNSNIGYLLNNIDDKFQAKNRILIATELDSQLTTILNKNVYTIICDNFIGCNNCCAGIQANFIQPIQDDNVNYANYGSLGLSFDIIDLPTTNSNLILYINDHQETIVRIIYDSLYANKEFVIKHPRIDDYFVINLPTINSTINLENYI